MDKLREILNQYMTDGLYQIIISKARQDKNITKVKIRPVLLKGELYFQASATVGTRQLHKNYRKEEMTEEILGLMERQFGQMQMFSREMDATVLVSKKGRMTVKTKKHQKKESDRISLEHNREKEYILPAGRPVDFLVDLGVMNKDGQIIHAKYDKFRQINRFLEFIEDILPRLARDREITIVDFGCGKSYLTFAMYYYLRNIKGFDVRIIGLDLKEDVIRRCNELRSRYGFEKLDFYVGDIAGFERKEPVDMVVTLHACDTATDYALAKAVEWSASVILSVPCCQHELNGQITNDILKPVLSYGIIKERMAALITDGLRAGMLEEQGYDTQILEFIDMEHTPKNLLIRAVKTEEKRGKSDSLSRCMEFLHVDPTLRHLLNEKENREAADEKKFD
ncbi:MAG: class I SAM-dependent methyltransferase [Ruminococcus sp.]|jgi:SAM-dependent methyltransferase